MAFSELHIKRIIALLGPKITKPCPSCGESQKRTVVPYLFLFTSYSPPSKLADNLKFMALNKALSGRPDYQYPPVSPGYIETPTLVSEPTDSFKAPCIMTVCSNCGLTEFYNVHVTTGLAELVGVPPAGQPIP